MMGKNEEKMNEMERKEEEENRIRSKIYITD